MIFCYVCPICGHFVETPTRDPAPTCTHEGARYFPWAAGIDPGEPKEAVMIRDYRTENVNIDKSSLR